MASTALGSVSAVLEDAVAAIGLQIAVYYGLAGLAVVVAYRKLLFKSAANFFFGGLWPLTGSLFMIWVFVESLGSLSGTAVSIGVGGIAVGLVPMLWYRAKGSPYYRPARLDAARSEQVHAEYGHQAPVYAASSGDTLSTDF